MLNRFIAFVVAIAAGTGVLPAISATVQAARHMGIELLSLRGLLHQFVQGYDEFKERYLVPNLIPYLDYFRIDYLPWMSDVAGVYYFISLGMTLILFLPRDALLSWGDEVTAAADVVKSIPGILRIPALLVIAIGGPIILILARIMFGVMFVIVGIALLVFFKLAIFLLPLLVGLLILAAVNPLAALGVVIMLAFLLFAAMIGQTLKQAGDGLVRPHGLEFNEFLGVLTFLIPVAALMGSVVVFSLIAFDLVWVLTYVN